MSPKRILSAKKWCWLVLFVVLLFFAAMLVFVHVRPRYPALSGLLAQVTDCKDHGPLVPNIVHLLHFGWPELNFFEFVTIMAAHRNQAPDKIYVHCNCLELKGKYWDMVRDLPELEVRYKTAPRFVFGRKLVSPSDVTDVARIEVLMEHGGIHIDSNTYVGSSLDEFRRHDLSVGWPLDRRLETHVLVARKNAPSLKLWYETYRYRVSLNWQFNWGVFQGGRTMQRIPSLVGAIQRDTDARDAVLDQHTEQWRSYKTVHFLTRDSDGTEIDEENVKTFNGTFGDMARLAVYGTADLIL